MQYRQQGLFVSGQNNIGIVICGNQGYKFNSFRGLDWPDINFSFVDPPLFGKIKNLRISKATYYVPYQYWTHVYLEAWRQDT